MPYLDPKRQSQHQYARMKKRRDEWFDKNGPCVRCKSWKQLELDHRDPTTKVSHAIWSWSDARRAVELAKCQALCHPCHLTKSIEEFKAARPRKHGAASYNKGCRCASCRAAKNAQKKRWRERLHGLTDKAALS